MTPHRRPLPRARRLRRVTTGLALASVTALVSTGCGSDSDDQAADADQDAGVVRVLASTNVWGDIASIVGGDKVQVTSLISDPSQDPYSFEASSTSLLDVKKADVVIKNGGGYDDFMDTMLTSSGSDATVIDAVEVSGKTAAAGEELNEHVWYDFPTAVAVAQQVSDALGEADPTDADAFDAGAAKFADTMQQLIDQEAQDEPDLTGRSIAITEPVPLYLTGALGLTNATPSEFSEAVEEGDDVPVAVLKETLDLFSSGQVSALVYNDQTSGPVTEQVKQAATDADVAVVPVTETLPDGMTYPEWMQSNLDAVVDAVSAP